ncbi:HAD family hydrolase [Acinetobacter sp. Marseille-Q1623]|uniref:HAD family hydrolase n=1 Tax=Acinetobacter sp. Marseille-Q1623 TaxID=2697501 RepID=UPI00157A2979|nr:HAD family hydrolase [Acinetobacter sp. Marseille-Q1623]
MNHKPLVFVDLDDTLFQTNRKSAPTDLHKIATTDKSGQPLSYMKPKQQVFVNWLLDSAEVVPVTARSVEALQRVHLPFQSGAVCSHGGTIIDAQQNIDMDWFDIQKNAVANLNDLLDELPEILLKTAQDLGSIRTWTVEENDLKIYTVAKQNQPEDGLFLDQLVKHLPKDVLEHCYVHINGNNLAVIPKFVSKQKAVEFFIEKYDPQGERVILGWGDSLSDAGFLGCCDWFGMPKNSQLDQFLAHNLSNDHRQKGFLGHV